MTSKLNWHIVRLLRSQQPNFPKTIFEGESRLTMTDIQDARQGKMMFWITRLDIRNQEVQY